MPSLVGVGESWYWRVWGQKNVLKGLKRHFVPPELVCWDPVLEGFTVQAVFMRFRLMILSFFIQRNEINQPVLEEKNTTVTIL